MKTKKINLCFLVLATGFIFILCTCTKNDKLTRDLDSSQAVLKSGNGPSANGQGSYQHDGFNSHIAINAHTMPNGNVQGIGVLTRSGNGSTKHLQFDIDCLLVEGNVATMSGTTTSSTFELCPVGTPIVFRVVDNGQGGSDPDQFTGIYLPIDEGWDDWDCNNFPEQYLFNMEQGNIHVNP